MANSNLFAIDKLKTKALADYPEKVDQESVKEVVKKEKPSILQLPSEGLLTSN